MCSPTFILRLRLPGGMTSEAAVELLGAANYTDVLVGMGEPRVLALAFTGPVVLSEFAEMARAIPAAELLRFGPDGELSS